jgi:hypothetical protein
MRTKVYDIRRKDLYSYCSEVYRCLSDKDKYKIADIIPKEIYHTILFNKCVLNDIEEFCSKFFDCNENNLSYELGCYFQKIKYVYHIEIEKDIKKFKKISNTIDSNKYPETATLIDELIFTLEKSLIKYKEFEEDYPDIFEI